MTSVLGVNQRVTRCTARSTANAGSCNRTLTRIWILDLGSGACDGLPPYTCSRANPARCAVVVLTAIKCVLANTSNVSCSDSGKKKQRGGRRHCFHFYFTGDIASLSLEVDRVCPSNKSED